MNGTLVDFAWLLRVIAASLSWPTHLALLLGAGVGLWDIGLTLGERWRGLETMRRSATTESIAAVARRRVDRADLLARLGPMIGLMGTLIPLGPGLGALGRGDTAELARAVTVAFDTTVLGLSVGIIGLVVGRLRRRWYDALLDERQVEHA